MGISRQWLATVALVCGLCACGGSGNSADTIADIAQDRGWSALSVKILNVGYLANAGIFDGACVIGIYPPGAAELAGTIWPDQAPVFQHIGDAVAQCLSGRAPTLLSLPSHYDVFLDELVRIDYDADVDDCGQQFVGGCYQEWANLAVVLPDRLLGLVGLTVSYDELESVVVGHEIWHMVAGDFHS